ncbi:MAG: hypothetical protein WBW33_12785 [Bryobacteraceae bacterium]
MSLQKNKEFDAEGLVARLIGGEFDEDLAEQVRRLFPPQLNEVVRLLESSPETTREITLIS